VSVESVTTPQDFNITYPAAGDVLTEGDNHERNLKVGIKRLCWEHVGTSAVAGATSISTYALFGAFEAGYDYHATFEDMYMASANSLDFRVTTGGGVVDTGSNYAHSIYTVAPATGNGSSSATSIVSLAATGDAATETSHSEVTLLNPQGTTNPRHVLFACDGGSTATGVSRTTGAGMYKTTTAIDGIYALSNSASLAITGTVKLYRRFRPT
jgi:hypothetical protein